MKLVDKRIIDAALDEAASWAKKNAQEGVNLVVAMLNASGENSAKVQYVMESAINRGFECYFYPVNGQMGIRVRWENPK